MDRKVTPMDASRTRCILKVLDRLAVAVDRQDSAQRRLDKDPDGPYAVHERQLVEDMDPVVKTLAEVAYDLIPYGEDRFSAMVHRNLLAKRRHPLRELESIKHLEDYYYDLLINAEKGGIK